MPETLIKRLVTEDLALNKTVLAKLAAMGIVSKKSLSRVALNTIGQYKKRFSQELADGATRKQALRETLADKQNLVNRVENTIVFEVGKEIKDQYEGEFYVWLPSDAQEPDPEHALNYGKKFQIGDGEMPGERWGCRCGMQILVDDSELEL